MTLSDNASVAHATISLAMSGEPLAAGVLTCMPGMGTLKTTLEIGKALDMEVVEIRTPMVEYHPGAINLVAYDQVETAVATGRPVLFVFMEANAAQKCVLAALTSAIARRVEDAPCVLLALTSQASENDVADQIAEGLDVESDRIARFRTHCATRRLVDGVLKAMQ